MVVVAHLLQTVHVVHEVRYNTKLSPTGAISFHIPWWRLKNYGLQTILMHFFLEALYVRHVLHVWHLQINLNALKLSMEDKVHDGYFSPK